MIQGMTSRRSVRLLAGIMLIGVVIAVVFVILQNRASAVPNNALSPQSAAASISLSTIDGQTVSLPGNPGQITVVYTMGYWCADCVPGAKTLTRLQTEYGSRGVRFIAVDVSPQVTATDLQPFVQVVGDNHLTWAMDASGRFAYLYKIQTLDTAILLDGQGQEVYRGGQSSSDTNLRAALDKLLG